MRAYWPSLQQSAFASFDRETESSDGGALLIKAADRKLNLTEHLSKSICERRQAEKILHPMNELMRKLARKNQRTERSYHANELLVVTVKAH